MSTDDANPAGGTNRHVRHHDTRRGPTPATTRPLREDSSLAIRPNNSTQEVSPSIGHTANSQRNRSRRDNSRRGRDGKEREQRALDSSSLIHSSTQVADYATSSTSAQWFNQESRSRRFRGRGRGISGGRRDAQSMFNEERGPGGQSSFYAPENSSYRSTGGDTEFVSGSSITSRPRTHARPARNQRASRSEAPDITTRIHEDIMNGLYECVICTNEVLSNSKIWACETCWSVLHLSCVKRWFSNDVSTNQSRENENAESTSLKQWRCPGCNSPNDALRKSYSCWCCKEIEPRYVPGLPPHSCGQTCAKPRSGVCPHPCESICHAGPCPTCKHMGPSLSCFCKKKESTKQCIDTKYKVGWSCEQVCGNILSCREHKCQKKCHKGPCGACEVLIESRCCCGNVVRDMICSERSFVKESRLNGKNWSGSFNCGSECRRIFDCGNLNHFCQRKCHPQDEKPAHCPYSPDVVLLCPCGKTPLSSLLEKPRKDCSAPIPHCTEICRKTLPCGHLCQRRCHYGECRHCLELTQISCHCTRVSSTTLCHQGTEERPQCPRVCRATLNCGRHECGHRCCPGEKKATERQASRRKYRGLNVTNMFDNSFEPEHICIKICGRPLKCGSHSCSSLCHKGSCPGCLEAIFDEISCACGKTVLQPPQPCGTTAPECHFDCHRLPRCGHSKIKHQCHQDSDPCPKCPFLMEKICICGKKTLKNQPCWFGEVRCGFPCRKKLKCGIHYCQKLCHQDVQCEDSDKPCTQPCGRKKTVCEHACSDRCHAPYPCKEIELCQAMTFITCACQNQKQPVRCLSSKASAGSSEKKLTCNDDCLKAQRNAKLANALIIDPTTHDDEHIPYSTKTLSFFASDQMFVQKYEREFRVFASKDSEKMMRFKPMPAHQRAFIHSLAIDFGLDSTTQDAEPHRHVSIFKTPRFVSAPLKTLSQCLRVKPVPKPQLSVLNQLVENAEPWNAFLLVAPRFGLTIDETQTTLRSEFSKSNLEFNASFIPSGNVVLHFISSQSWPKDFETMLNLKNLIASKVKISGLAASTSFCAVDENLNVIRRENDGSANHGDWNQVVKSGSISRRVLQQGVGRTSSFAVLGRTKKEIDDKVTEEDAPDDWEKEVEGWA